MSLQTSYVPAILADDRTVTIYAYFIRKSIDLRIKYAYNIYVRRTPYDSSGNTKDAS